MSKIVSISTAAEARKDDELRESLLKSGAFISASRKLPYSLSELHLADPEMKKVSKQVLDYCKAGHMMQAMRLCMTFKVQGCDLHFDFLSAALMLNLFRQGISARVVTLQELDENYSDFFDELPRYNVIFVRNFFEIEKAMPDKDLRRIEYMLKNRLTLNQARQGKALHATFFHSAFELDINTCRDWWSSSFMYRLADMNAMTILLP